MRQWTGAPVCPQLRCLFVALWIIEVPESLTEAPPDQVLWEKGLTHRRQFLLFLAHKRHTKIANGAIGKRKLL